MVVVIIEPFFGGSHKQLIDFLTSFCLINTPFELHTLPAKKWHWRARTSALYFAQNISRKLEASDVLFCSSVLNLAEFVALRPDVQRCRKKIIYFHENQLVYPVKKSREERDFQYGYNQILSALAADQVLFNSDYNKTSFIDSIPTFMKLQPDFRPNSKLIQDDISSKSEVLYFPLELPNHRNLHRETNEAMEAQASPEPNKQTGKVTALHIVWPHRWEHDKDPDTFFKVLFRLEEAKLDFKVSILGQSFEDVPEIFAEAKERLGPRIVHFGPLESRADYFEVLQRADVVVSTALHEFFGVAMIEAAASGCYPLVPNRLVYPEIYPADNHYNTEEQLYKRLREFCRKPHLAAVLWNPDISKAICGKFSQDAQRQLYYHILTYNAKVT